MSEQIKILAMAGSTRKDSYNKKLIRAAGNILWESDVDITLIDLRDYPLPLFDGDLETDRGMPAPALELKKLLMAQDALIISAPEYNNSVTGVLKNTIDWMSRTAAENDPGDVFEGKVGALISASPGHYGGIRGLLHMRAILTSLGVLVIPTQCCIHRAHEAFDERGKLKDERFEKRLRAVTSQLLDVTRAMSR